MKKETIEDFLWFALGTLFVSGGMVFWTFYLLSKFGVNKCF